MINTNIRTFSNNVQLIEIAISGNRPQIHKWCEEHTIGEWGSTPSTVLFEKEQDAIMFKLSYV